MDDLDDYDFDVLDQLEARAVAQRRSTVAAPAAHSLWQGGAPYQAPCHPPGPPAWRPPQQSYQPITLRHWQPPQQQGNAFPAAQQCLYDGAVPHAQPVYAPPQGQWQQPPAAPAVRQWRPVQPSPPQQQQLPPTQTHYNQQQPAQAWQPPAQQAQAFHQQLPQQQQWGGVAAAPHPQNWHQQPLPQQQQSHQPPPQQQSYQKPQPQQLQQYHPQHQQQPVQQHRSYQQQAPRAPAEPRAQQPPQQQQQRRQPAARQAPPGKATQRSLYTMWQQAGGPAAPAPATHQLGPRPGTTAAAMLALLPVAPPQPPRQPRSPSHAGAAPSARQLAPLGPRPGHARYSGPSSSIPMQRQEGRPPAPQQQLQQEGEEGPDILAPGTSEGGPLLKCSTATGGLRVHSLNAAHWVYPAGIPERPYQLACIRTALLANTLVCLPTGLGKTLIAAVVMHNFARWFPEGKVVFVAPTRPLVAQQINACQRFMGLAPRAAAELTGNVKGEARKEAWNDPHVRAVFCTPQTFWNDVKRGVCPYDSVTCLVVDECHRATGGADIVSAVKFMRDQKRLKFRVLGLSATPGAGADQVQEVMTNLGVAAVEFRCEEDEDVAPHVHPRSVVTHVVAAAGQEAGTLRALLLAVLQQLVGHLASARVYFGSLDSERVTRFGLLQAGNAARAAAAAGTAGAPSAAAAKLFRQASLLADLREQLDSYGVQAAMSYLNTKMGEGPALRELAGTSPVFAHFVHTLGAAAASGGSALKMRKLVEVLRGHFEAAAAGTGAAKAAEVAPPAGRVIVFTNLREGVTSILAALRQHEPLIAARAFVGQGGSTGRASGTGMKQREQKAVLEGFRKGEFNVLVATCIGEEGLDILAVDLIVCYDATASPTRAVQREGRTGRHRQGKVVYILAAGKEEEAFNRIADTTKRLHAQLRDAGRHFTLHAPNPRMLPRQFNPEKLDVAVAVHPEVEAKQGRGRSSGGRGRGRSGKAAAVEPVEEGAAEFEALAGTAAGVAGKGRGSGGSSRGGRGRGRVAAPRRKLEPIIFDDDEADSDSDADSWDGPRPPSPPPSPLPSQQGGGRAAEEAGVNDSAPQAPAHRLLYPRSAAFIRCSGGGRFSVVPPPPLAALLGPPPETPPAAGAVPQLGTPQQAQHVPHLVEGGGLELPGGVVLRFGDPGVHRWAFLATAGAQQRRQQQAATAGPPDEGALAAGKPAVAVAGKPARKAGAPARKRKAAPPAQQQQVPAQQQAKQPFPQGQARADAAALPAVPEPEPAEPEPAPTAAGLPAGPEVVDLTFDSDGELGGSPAGRAGGAAGAAGAGAPLEMAAAAPVGEPAPSLSQQPLAVRLRQRRQRLQQEACGVGGSALAQRKPQEAAAAEEDVPLAKRKKMLRSSRLAAGVPPGAPPPPPNSQQQQQQQQQQQGMQPTHQLLTTSSAAPSLDENAALPRALPPPSPRSQRPHSQPHADSWDFDDLGGGGLDDFSPAGINHDFYDVADDEADDVARGEHGEWGSLGAEAVPPADTLAAAPAAAAHLEQAIEGNAQPAGAGWAAGRQRTAAALRCVILDSPASTAPSLSGAGGSAPPQQSTQSPGVPLVAPAPRPSRFNRLRKAAPAAAPTAAVTAPAQKQQRRPAPPAAAKRVPKRFRAADFLDVEAALSGDDSGGEGEGEEEGMDGFESDFINDGTQAPPSGSTPGAGPASLAAFHHRCLLEERRSPSPGELLRRLQSRRARSRDPGLGAGGCSGGLGAEEQEDAYDEDDSFIDDDEGGSDGGVEGDGHEDGCVACEVEGGLLVLCDGCPAAYHLACAGLATVPQGDWFCAMCVDLERFGKP